MTTKRCSKCEQEKPADTFSASASTLDGLSRWCRACNSAYQQKHRQGLAYVPMPRALHKQLRYLALDRDSTVVAVVTELLTSALAQAKAPE